MQQYWQTLNIPWQLLTSESSLITFVGNYYHTLKKLRANRLHYLHVLSMITIVTARTEYAAKNINYNNDNNFDTWAK
jgi:hypothetical protein